MKPMSDSYPSNTNNSVMREHLISSVPFESRRHVYRMHFKVLIQVIIESNAI